MSRPSPGKPSGYPQDHAILDYCRDGHLDGLFLLYLAVTAAGFTGVGYLRGFS